MPVTVTSTVPTVPAGLMALIWLSETTVKEAGVEPKLTAVVPVKPVPAIVTGVPPADEPDEGLRAIRSGAFHVPTTGVPAKLAGPYTKVSSAKPLSLLFRRKKVELLESYRPTVSSPTPVQSPVMGLKLRPLFAGPYKNVLSAIPVVLLSRRKKSESDGLYRPIVASVAPGVHFPAIGSK